MMQTQAQPISPISKWLLAWADAKPEIRNRTGNVMQLDELDRLMAELIDLMLATDIQSDAALRREWGEWDAASDQDLRRFGAALEME